MATTDLKDKVRGSLVGGAVGDALGYPVEFISSFENIEHQYGEGGIQDYDTRYPWLHNNFGNQSALFSDDTQMTLYTAEGLLYAEKNGVPALPMIRDAYLYWMGGQNNIDIQGSYPSELKNIQELNQRRAPGNTCLSALISVHFGANPENNSKGCGGIMRIAPIALYGAAHDWTLEKTAQLAGETAEITHKHKMSTLASACAAAIIQLCVGDENSKTIEGFAHIVDSALDCIEKVYPDVDCLQRFKSLILKALSLKDSPDPDWNVIERQLGGGWIAEETLAIAVFCVARHIGSFTDCLVSAVNHGGDSDSTGAVAGNIIGAILGYHAIPEKFTQPLQLMDLLINTADSLAS